ncbi:hypothetical protein DB30_01502 [Enhygromyxa salina]|uniref:Uncharacterized protein n=1 Tax=Enhygromyxa salina TaxID=215803 RepID=A0A0C2CX47_9BACT|nr:hypothetical protein DB30_01502 [Enhygromyxa salina]
MLVGDAVAPVPARPIVGHRIGQSPKTEECSEQVRFEAAGRALADLFGCVTSLVCAHA